MRAAALEVVRCPACGGSLRLESAADPAGDAGLRCACGEGYPVVGGVPRFVDGRGESDRARRRTRRAFEVEWKVFGSSARIYAGTAAESMALLFEEIGQSGLSPDWLRGRRVLDAGCGHGRYVFGLAALGAEAWGLDLGLGIDVAARNKPEGVEVNLVQGDLLRPPLAPSSFDLVISKGVLHYMPDPEGGVRALARLLRAGGYLFVWVYPRYPTWFLLPQEAIRRVTRRLPPRLLVPLCFAAAPLLGLVVRHGVGVRTHAASRHRSLARASVRERAQMIYDWYSPWIQTYHEPAEVSGWLESSGLVEVKDCPIPAGASGRMPVAPSAGPHPVAP
jgi:SAM-dependent methyltransferase